MRYWQRELAFAMRLGARGVVDWFVGQDAWPLQNRWIVMPVVGVFEFAVDNVDAAFGC